MTKYNLDTMNYAEDRKESQRLDNARKLARIEIRLDMAYTPGQGAHEYHNGNPGSIINDLKIGAKGFNVFEADGWDLYYIAWLLNKREPDMIEVDPNETVGRLTINLPLQIAPGQLRNVNLTVLWGDEGDIGDTFTVNGAALNGIFEQNDNPAANIRVVPVAETATTGRDHAYIDDAGRLTGALVLTRYTDGEGDDPFELFNFMDHLSVRINGVYPVVDVDWETLQNAFLQKTNTAGDYLDGVGYIDLSDETYIPKEGSRFEWEGGNDECDVIFYQIFEPVDTPTQEKTGTLSEIKPGGSGSARPGDNNSGAKRPGDLGLGKGSTGLGLGI
jgi:hypothetical protein